jgi:nitrogen fixation/metabolism regulation signal transduction histidine kinase
VKNGKAKNFDSVDAEVISQVDSLISRWVSSLADQVINPVAGISAAVEIIDHQLSHFVANGRMEVATAKHAIALVMARLNALNAYIGEISDFAKPAKVNLNSHYLEDLIETAIDKFLSGPHKHTKIQTNIHPHVNSIFCDDEKLHRILIALFYNASEAVNSDTSPEIFVIAEPDIVDDMSGISIRIIDNGPGIPEENVEHLIRPFVSSKEASTGLGLAVCNKLTRAHGGKLIIQPSHLSSGAMVSIFFPNYNPLRRYDVNVIE